MLQKLRKQFLYQENLINSNSLLGNEIKMACEFLKQQKEEFD